MTTSTILTQPASPCMKILLASGLLDPTPGAQLALIDGSAGGDGAFGRDTRLRDSESRTSRTRLQRPPPSSNEPRFAEQMPLHLSAASPGSGPRAGTTGSSPPGGP
ncbi:MAG: hypothetical protein WC704_03720 [Sphingomonas sp.]